MRKPQCFFSVLTLSIYHLMIFFAKFNILNTQNLCSPQNSLKKNSLYLKPRFHFKFRKIREYY